ncbi:unnamed protein product [Phaedon cochleariae]|uniref:Uncharacterized protein n=1 Tax=Phaedon cochleariae TaxID=80249 RepID=A0A9N9SDB3_PHACE|nr:unnamed protein product [Phaedon cochleariae]
MVCSRRPDRHVEDTRDERRRNESNKLLRVHLDILVFSRDIKARRPSLERQSTLYDDCSYYDYTTSIQNDTGNSSHHVLEQIPSCDEYYDVQPYSYQDDRFGQEEEDRQWDSGGFHPYPPHPRPKKLPSIPAIQKPLPHSDTYSVYEEPSRPTSTNRRKMPQIPTKRTSWRQEPSEGSHTPEYSHRGASLPPTPTKTSKMSSRLSQVLASNGRAPTPGRQLPKPVSNYSARAKRNRLIKRTSSADYADNFTENDYVRTGATSALDNYNEDYNYAYQSNDNLPLDPEEDIYVRTEQTNSYYSQNPDYNQSYYDVKIPVPPRKKLLGENDANFVQQNTDSLESRDDELKDSFETPVSSMSSSLQIIKPNAYPEASSELMSPNIAQKNILNAMSHQGELDQLRALENTNPSSLTVAQVHNHNSLGSNKTFMKQLSCVDNGYYMQGQFDGMKDSQMTYGSLGQEDSYLEVQESVESYVEDETEDSVAYGSNTGIGTAQAINHDSPLSVIHVESREDEQQTLRSRESSQVSVAVDPFHATALKQRQQQQQQQQAQAVVPRRSSGAETAYQNFNDNLLCDDTDQFPTSYPRVKPAALDAPLVRQPSVRRSPPTPEKPPETPPKALDEPAPAPVTQPAPDHREDEAGDHRPKITAQQRWLWAYNKIIMQMDGDLFDIMYDFRVTSKTPKSSHLSINKSSNQSKPRAGK